MGYGNCAGNATCHHHHMAGRPIQTRLESLSTAGRGLPHMPGALFLLRSQWLQCFAFGPRRGRLGCLHRLCLLFGNQPIEFRHNGLQAFGALEIMELDPECCPFLGRGAGASPSLQFAYRAHERSPTVEAPSPPFAKSKGSRWHAQRAVMAFQECAWFGRVAAAISRLTPAEQGMIAVIRPVNRPVD